MFGLVSYLCKEKLYLSEALISTVAGLIFSPHAANLIKPLEYAQGSPENLDAITLYFSRLVLGVQLVLAGIQLPSKYLQIEWKSLSILLGPGMIFMWLVTSLLIWGFVPNLPFLHALAVGACVTPTDPILSNSIVKGKFADQNIPRELQKMIIAESGANDGLAYPFLFLPLYLIRYTQNTSFGASHGARTAIGYWFGVTWGYVIIMSILYGALVGFIFKEALHWAKKRNYVDRESFLVFAITIALFIVGTAGMLGSDDVLACFIAGNVFTWDDWFRLETIEDSFQPTIDMLLNVAIFAWYGAICPWGQFVGNSAIPIYRLIFLAVLVLLLRRLPFVLAVHKKIPQIEEFKQAAFVGFFGPIGVSAIFYLYTTLEFLREIQTDGVVREDAASLEQVVIVVVWFLTICSIVVHGLSVPLGKLGFYIPRVASRAVSFEPQTDNDEPAPFHIRQRTISLERALEQGLARRIVNTASRSRGQSPDRPLFRIGGSLVRDNKSKENTLEQAAAGRGLSQSGSSDKISSNVDSDRAAHNQGSSEVGLVDRPSTPAKRKLIKFPDEPSV